MRKSFMEFRWPDPRKELSGRCRSVCVSRGSRETGIISLSVREWESSMPEGLWLKDSAVSFSTADPLALAIGVARFAEDFAVILCAFGIDHADRCRLRGQPLRREQDDLAGSKTIATF